MHGAKSKRSDRAESFDAIKNETAKPNYEKEKPKE
jgi:hypothetical protein